VLTAAEIVLESPLSRSRTLFQLQTRQISTRDVIYSITTCVFFSTAHFARLASLLTCLAKNDNEDPLLGDVFDPPPLSARERKLGELGAVTRQSNDAIMTTGVNEH
jgi:hypothetical protein